MKELTSEEKVRGLLPIFSVISFIVIAVSSLYIKIAGFKSIFEFPVSIFICVFLIFILINLGLFLYWVSFRTKRAYRKAVNSMKDKYQIWSKEREKIKQIKAKEEFERRGQKEILKAVKQKEANFIEIQRRMINRAKNAVNMAKTKYAKLSSSKVEKLQQEHVQMAKDMAKKEKDIIRMNKDIEKLRKKNFTDSSEFEKEKEIMEGKYNKMKEKYEKKLELLRKKEIVVEKPKKVVKAKKKKIVKVKNMKINIGMLIKNKNKIFKPKPTLKEPEEVLDIKEIKKEFPELPKSKMEVSSFILKVSRYLQKRYGSFKVSDVLNIIIKNYEEADAKRFEFYRDVVDFVDNDRSIRVKIEERGVKSYAFT